MLTVCVTGATALSVYFLYSTYDLINSNLIPNDPMIANNNLNLTNEILDVYSKDDVTKFIALNFLDLIFKLSDDSITSHYNEIINNEGFFKLIKAVFSEDKISKVSMHHLTDRFCRGELISFFENLKTCNNKDDFNSIYKNRRILKHLIISMKNIYKL